MTETMLYSLAIASLAFPVGYLLGKSHGYLKNRKFEKYSNQAMHVANPRHN